MKISFRSMGLLLFYVLSWETLAATKNDPHAPITHCYHWLTESSKNFLSFKYTFAKTHGNELTFFTTGGNGAIAGPGLYCGKTPADSYDYGDRVIRVDFTEDVVLLDSLTGIQYCGIKGETSKTSKACADKTWDVKFYKGGDIGNFAWYVIQNPMAIDSWSSNSDQVEEDLKINIDLNDGNYKARAEDTLRLIAQERKIMGKQTYQNQNSRLSIIDIILKDPKRLDSIPPLNIVSRVLSDGSGRLSSAEKTEIYQKFIRRSLLSNDTEYAAISELGDKDRGLKDIISEAVMDGLKDVEKQNPLLLLGLMSNNSRYFKGVPDSTYQRLVERLLGNSDLTLQLSKSDIPFDDRVKGQGVAVIKRMAPLPYNSKNTSTLTIPTVFKSFARGSELSRLTLDWKAALFSSNKEIVGIGIGNETFYMKTYSSNQEEQCTSAAALAGANDLSLIFKDQKIKVGKAPEDCAQFSGLIHGIVKNNLINAGGPLHFVTGKVEATTPFLFAAQYADDIIDQCKKFYPSLPNQDKIDDMTISIDGGKEAPLHNGSSYWTSKETFCNAIVSGISSTILTKAENDRRSKIEAFNAASRDRKRASPSGYLVEGNIEGLDFVFFGTMLDDIYDQCTSFHPLIVDPGKVDDIQWKIGSDRLAKIHNAQSYWTTASQVCTAVKEALISSVPSRNSLQRDALSAKWSATRSAFPNGFEVKGRIEASSFLFYGPYREEILAQCREFFDYLDQKDGIDDISTSVNGARETVNHNGKSNWQGKDQVCTVLVAGITTTVPGKQEAAFAQKIKAMMQTASSAGSYNVRGTIEGIPFQFFGYNREEISNQCQEYFPYLLNPGTFDDAEVTVNALPRQTMRNGNSYWKTPSDFCGQLLTTIASSVLSKQEIVGLQNQNELIQATTPNNLAADFQRTVDDQMAQYSASHPYKVSGAIGRYPFYLYGDNFEEISQRCDAYAKAIPQNDSVANFNFIFQRDPSRVISDNGTTRQLCQGLLPQLELSIPTQEEIEFQLDDRSFVSAFEGSSALYKGKVKLNNRFFYFYGMDSRGIKKQCSDFFPSLHLSSKPTDVLYQLNGKEAKRASLGGYSLTASSLCKKIEGLLKREISN